MTGIDCSCPHRKEHKECHPGCLMYQSWVATQRRNEKRRDAYAKKKAEERAADELEGK